MAKKVTVDTDTCIGCGLCTGVCGDAFALDENGKSSVVLEGGVVPAELTSSVEDAAAQCPVQAIKVE
jgi:ferredoxin